MRQPHLLERGTVRDIDDPVLGRFQVPGSPLNFSLFPPEPSLVAPGLGQHNAEILGRWAGCSAADIERLTAAGVLHAEAPPKE
jgi:CoA:oxalate CoA-transferase